MITVTVELGSRGNLVAASATGHAGKGSPGSDIVCAAVTILLRTTMTVLHGAASPGNGIEICSETAGRGSLAFRVTAFGETDVPFLEYAAVFLREGLGSLAGEYPEAVAVNVL